MVKILVVEDEESIRVSIIDMLELAKHNVISASDGYLGLEQAKINLPDLIISDIMMPTMDGYALFEAIKSDSATAHIPFIFLTALASYDDVRAGMNLGADDYLTKPFNYKQLTNAVEARLNKYVFEERTRLQQFARRLVDLQERERRMLAHDIEVDIQEPLSGLKMLLNIAQQTQDLAVIDTAVPIMDNVISQTAGLSLRLMPTMIDHLNIISVLNWLFEQYKINHQLRIDFERAGHTPQCTTEEKVAIYRVFDEVLKNIVQHSETKDVMIRISVRDNRLYADIRENGKGFDVHQALQGSTVGIQSMIERVTLLNGEIDINSISGDGTQITLDLPIEITTDTIHNKSIISRKSPSVTVKPTSISSIRILIADDHDIIRHGLQQIIDQVTDMDIVAQAGDRNQLLQQLRQHDIDIIILDLAIDGSNGFDIIKIIRQQMPLVRILALSNQKQEVYAVEALKSGATGYILKESTSLEIIDAIHKVARGEQYIGQALAEKAFEWMLNSRSNAGYVANIYDLLTDREREILLLAIEGLTSVDIADKLSISPRTVEKHRSNFMSKLGLKTPTQLIKFATEYGLLS